MLKTKASVDSDLKKEPSMKIEERRAISERAQEYQKTIIEKWSPNIIRWKVMN